jgi:hypothetical protein
MITTNCSSESPVTVTAVMYLTEEDQSLLEKLENPEYRNKIDAIAKDMHINWAVVKAYDNENLNLEVSRTFDYTVTVTDRCDVKKACIKFAEEVSMLTLPAFDEPKCPTHEDAEVLAEELAFVKGLKEKLNDIRGALIMPSGIPEPLAFLTDNYCTVSPMCVRHMIDAYIKEYDHE